MGYRVQGRLDTATITVTAKDAHDAAKQASELVKRGAHEIRIKDEDVDPREDLEGNPKIRV
jgi:hypothetical protein